jgi:hypothetical protein
LELDHLCRHRWCVNPVHLESVPHVVNMHRGVAPNILISLSGRCSRGHERTEANVYARKDGSGWTCRVCRRELRAARRK